MQSTHGPRKRRTREHVIADLSVNHVQRFVLEEGTSRSNSAWITATIWS
jgi:hypothetical protein